MERDLEALFSEVGEVVEVFLPSDRVTGRPRGFAFVEMAEDTAAAEAIERFDGYQLQGRSIRVNIAEEQTRRSPNFSDTRGPGQYRGGFKKPKSKGSRRNIRAKKRGH